MDVLACVQPNKQLTSGVYEASASRHGANLGPAESTRWLRGALTWAVFPVQASSSNSWTEAHNHTICSTK